MRNVRQIESTIRKLEAQLAATDVGDRSAMEIFQALKDARAEHAIAVQEQLEGQMFREPKAPRERTLSDGAQARLWSIAVETQTAWLRSDQPCHRGRIIGEAALARYKSRLAHARRGQQTPGGWAT